MNQLKGKTVIVTGASGGIGLEIARLAAEKGARTVLLARSLAKLESIQAELAEKYGAEVYVYQLDVSDANMVEQVFKKIFDTVGEADVLVNNAGYGIFKEADQTDAKEAEAMFRVNVLGLMACTNMVLPAMKRRRQGHIMNIASQAGKIATPKSSLYSATKFAVLGYSNALRLEVMEYGIHVTTVNPGPVETNFFSIADESGSYAKSIARFMLKSEEVAAKVVGAMLTNKREINLPGWMNAAGKLYTLFPGTAEFFGKKAFFKK
ncbi:SDR family NAD(P)-dependent oxidoreductase [Bacillus massiliglaciei]|uniref:SDR family NAD(P)-dependent oxidoreductase n=1 Tax=Bacillus massiliglaciei TaxID=1816693 RepID=UPI000A60646E|nr:SDR family oxidoreductase [Bacillus massiliglaciei]